MEAKAHLIKQLVEYRTSVTQPQSVPCTCTLHGTSGATIQHNQWVVFLANTPVSV